MLYSIGMIALLFVSIIQADGESIIHDELRELQPARAECPLCPVKTCEICTQPTCTCTISTAPTCPACPTKPDCPTTCPAIQECTPKVCPTRVCPLAEEVCTSYTCPDISCPGCPDCSNAPYLPEAIKAKEVDPSRLAEVINKKCFGLGCFEELGCYPILCSEEDGPSFVPYNKQVIVATKGGQNCPTWKEKFGCAGYEAPDTFTCILQQPCVLVQPCVGF